MSNFRIFGRISDRNSGNGIPNLRIEVWDKDVKNDDLCGTAVTDPTGSYQVEFDESAFKDSYKDILPDVYLRVFAQDELIISTEDAVRKNTPPGETEISLDVELPASTVVLTQIQAPLATNLKSDLPTNSKATKEIQKHTVPTTGLEDYARWKTMFKNHSPEKDPPFRRGRIWC